MNYIHQKLNFNPTVSIRIIDVARMRKDRTAASDKSSVVLEIQEHAGIISRRIYFRNSSRLGINFDEAASAAPSCVAENVDIIVAPAV